MKFKPLLFVSFASACQVEGTNSQLLATPVTVELDFSNANNAGGEVGYRYYYNGGNYPANYDNWTEWSCEDGPDCFGA